MAKLKIDKKFWITPNEVLNSKNLSFKAKWIYWFLQSKPDNWNFSVKWISSQSKESKESISAWLKELEDQHLLKREKFQDNKWHWGIEYILFSEIKTENPVPENPQPEKPDTGKIQNISKKDLSKKEEVKKNNNPKGLQSEIVWINFWEKEISEKKQETEKEEYWNHELNQLLEFLKKLFSRENFKESQTWQRRYLKHILNLMQKDWKEIMINKLNILKNDMFKFKNCGSLKYIFSELKSLPADIQTMKATSQKVATNF